MLSKADAVYLLICISLTFKPGYERYGHVFTLTLMDERAENFCHHYTLWLSDCFDPGSVPWLTSTKITTQVVVVVVVNNDRAENIVCDLPCIERRAYDEGNKNTSQSVSA